jgi:hypothetical protein
MQDPATYTDAFEREHGCTVDEWLMWLPGAAGDSPLSFDGAGTARVRIGDGSLQLHWQALPQRQIAQVRLPRLRVSYRFDGVSEDARARFMQRFDLYMQRGGG